MKTSSFKTIIKATSQTVWFVLWDDYHYRQWTSVFSEGSYAKTDQWKKGSRVHFLSQEGNGMYSEVAENEPNKKMVFRHLGEIKNGIEEPGNQAWAGAMEGYELKEENGLTTLTANMDMTEDFEAYFSKTIPLALERVKDLSENFFISVQTTVNHPVSSAWDTWNNPDDIIQWCTATETWHTPKASNDLTVGGKYFYRMEAKDGSMGFDLIGIYSHIEPKKQLEYSMEDGRKVKIFFSEKNGQTTILEQFQPENQNSLDLQRAGWQAILDNFKKHCEGKKEMLSR